MPTTLLPDLATDRIQHPFLIRAPQRGDERTAASITCQTMDRQLVTDQGHTVRDQIRIGLKIHHGHFPFGIFFCQICVLKHMQQLQFDPLDTG
ncbi:MAG: hypothetical protein IJ917_00595, partial [Firmicutes bacterium]|nr:hypothetical protein [Bacillota bacterium]